MSRSWIQRSVAYAAPLATSQTQPYALQQQFAAKKQVAMAIAGYPGLDSLSQAEDLQTFALPPVDDGGAYRHAAYWLGVAARLLGDRRLGATAGYYAQWSTIYPVASLSAGSIVKTMQEAGAVGKQAITTAAHQSGTSVDQIAYANQAVNKLFELSSPAAIARAQHDDTGFLADMRRLLELQEAMGKLATVATLGVGAVAVFVTGYVAWKIYKRVRK